MPIARAPDYIILAIGVIAVSTAAIFIRQADAPAMIIAAYRLVLACGPMLLLTAFRRESPVPAGRKRLVLTLIAGVALALHFAFWVASVQQTSVMTSVVLVTLAPLFVALASGPFLGERPTRAVWIGLAIAVFGTLVMVAQDFGAGGDTLQGDLFALLGAAFAAVFLLIGRKLLAGGASGWLGYSSATYVVAAVILVLLALLSGQAFTGYSGATYLYILLLALVPQVIGHTAVNRSLAVMPAFAVALAIQGEPIGATLLATVVLDELPSPLQLIGGLVVLAGVYIGVRSAATSDPKPTAPERQKP